jgi:hypothetical protein
MCLMTEIHQPGFRQPVDAFTVIKRAGAFIQNPARLLKEQQLCLV